ncbi:G-type lectin S-receptor-like serine/threonine-protein kinase SD1-13 [Hordeum vulgare subsp. vulgare]|uniref:Protein kinase domain-containing protein n=1 Tax=Hordeum vulgare subsp. vulgare TaxID=112509 RepID=A0A8I6WXK6_HORVV|nr:G-type lectin S-receptor-like serine/threonine-protein kinase SD1-13 [Hordeum vulgare subsp. vulgare]
MNKVAGFLRARRDTTLMTTSLSDSCCGNLYDYLLCKFLCHVTIVDVDDCDGQFTNATSERRFQGVPEQIVIVTMAGDHPPYSTSDDDPYANTTSKRIAMTPIDGGGAAPARSPDTPHVPTTLLETMLLDESSRPRDILIPLQELKDITDNFSVDRILGHGGFSVVYKGVLRNGELIAVKRIVSSLVPGLQKQFESEVYHLMLLKHPNIVRCIGYCYETRNACLEHSGKYVFAEKAERLLCLEYMPKGSLRDYLSDKSSGHDWSTRYNIIEGICFGLCYLHMQMDKPILHLDLKPANILLDADMLPKISDFGLSRLLDKKETICTTSRDGTFGYMSQEFLNGGKISPKSDIFSLGVIILEVVTGHRDYPDVTRTPSEDFIELTIRKWRNVLQRTPGCWSLIIDCEQIKRCLHVGLICVNPDRTKRPSIAKVISMLRGSESIDYDILQ